MPLSRLVRAAASASARRPRTTILLWLVLVAGCVFAGAMAGTKSLTGAEAGVGDSARADARIDAAGLKDPAVESVLVRSSHRARTGAAAAALQARLRDLPEVSAVRGPRDTPALSTAGGRTVLVQATLRGDPDDAADRVAPVERAVSAVARTHPGVAVRQAGGGSVDKAVNDMLAEDLQRSEVISIPLTLLILVVAFGALVAASVPLLLGVTSVAAAMGALGVISQIAPSSDSSGSLVVVIGLAVGVDYSLFYIRREREERRAGKGAHAALDATAATVGRAIVVSGLTVMVALAGLLFTGLAVFESMALATMAVVAIAVLGSLTVLPAVLELLGDRIDRGRLPRFGGRRRERRGHGAWGAIARTVTRHPAASLLSAVCVLGALAVPALQLKTAASDIDSLPAGMSVVRAQHAIERAFPGAPDDAELVVTGRDLGTPAAQQRLHRLGDRALAVTGGRGDVGVDVAPDGRTALVSVPMPDRGADGAERTVQALRDRVAGPAGALVTGSSAGNADFTHRLRTMTPIVVAFVLGLAFVLLVAAFRSPRLAATVIGLNVLSVAAAYGILAAVFQHGWAESLLGFRSTGTVIDWIPLFSFVILFGLSMDYTILVLERIVEARRTGRSAREAAADGVAATAGTVTTAAIVMVAVFAVFASLRMIEMKQLGVGLAAAILLDATIVRGIALPAAVTLLGERGWRVRGRSRRARWEDGRAMSIATQTGDER